jgi:hypothetical protein
MAAAIEAVVQTRQPAAVREQAPAEEVKAAGEGP